MSLLADTAVASPFVLPTVHSSDVAPPAQSREVHRLANTLLPHFSGDAASCILLLDLNDGGPSSLWLAAAVTSALGAALKRPLRLLSTDAPPPVGDKSAAVSGCLVEALCPAAASNERGSLPEYLADLRSAHQPVLLHAARESLLPEGVLHGNSINHVVLLARAARTRRAALQATVQRLSMAGVPLLGCVLLDRTHPIPEKLYRLL